MKMLPLVLVNLATVGAGIVAYDQFARPNDRRPADDTLIVGGEDRGTLELDARLAALERREPALVGAPRPELDRAAVIEILRSELARSAAVGPRSGGDSAVVVPATPSGIPEGLDAESLPDELVAAYGDPEIARFRSLYETVQAMERAEREAEREREMTKRMTARIDQLNLGLSDDQKAEILAAAAAMRTARNELFQRMRNGDADRSQLGAAMEMEQARLKSVIGRYVARSDDADRVAAIVGAGGWFASGGRGGEVIEFGSGFGAGPTVGREGRGGRGGAAPAAPNER